MSCAKLTGQHDRMRKEERKGKRAATPKTVKFERTVDRGGGGWMESKPNTQLLLLTAPELGGGVKVGEERVKLIRTEERVAAGLFAAGSSYAKDDGRCS